MPKPSLAFEGSEFWKTGNPFYHREYSVPIEFIDLNWFGFFMGTLALEKMQESAWGNAEASVTLEWTE